MKLLLITTISALALPVIALAQKEEGQQPQQAPAQQQPNEPVTAPGQQPAKETETTAPAKGKKAQASPIQEKSTTKTHEHAQTTTGPDGKKDAAAGATTSTSTTAGGTSNTSAKTTTKTVNKTEFRSTHSEIFSLGVHPKDFYVERYGASHFRLFGNVYYVYVDSCWVSVHVDGFGYTERVICPGDTDYVEVAL